MNKLQKSAGRVAYIMVAATVIGVLTGCAGVEHVGWVLAGTGKPATMVVANQTLDGEMFLRPDRTGEVRVRGSGASGSIASCAGSLRFSGSVQGRIDMRCSDGAMFDMAFYLINEVKGFASGTYQDRPVTLVFGMVEAEAQAYLSPAVVRPADAAKPAP